jgi:hypothetical protein
VVACGDAAALLAQAQKLLGERGVQVDVVAVPDLAADQRDLAALEVDVAPAQPRSHLRAPV